MPTDMLVKRDDLRTIEPRETAVPALAEGQALLRVERFALTANNVTYAVVGDQMAYWSFFPAPEGFGRVPVWGHATVEASRCAGLAEGERVYGYLPMSSHLIVEPTRLTDGGFVDGAAHRQPMAVIYNQYRRLGSGAGDAIAEDLRALFEPLFTTSFLIEDMFRRAGWHGADRLVMTSASSKTALALAHVARAKSPDVRRIGLTSPANRGFVEGTGLYDEARAYDAIDTLAVEPSVSVDFAGDGAVLAAIHHRLGDALKFSSRVGVTHWEERGGAAPMAGPTPVFFFAPTAAEALIGEIGPDAFAAARGEAWNGFVAEAAGWVSVEHGEGPEAVARMWRALVGGEARPATGYIGSL